MARATEKAALPAENSELSKCIWLDFAIILPLPGRCTSRLEHQQFGDEDGGCSVHSSFSFESR